VVILLRRWKLTPLWLVGRVSLGERSELDSESRRSRRSRSRGSHQRWEATPHFLAVVTGGIAPTVGAA